MTHLFRRASRACTAPLLALTLIAGASSAAAALPDTQVQNGVTYLTGGIGSDESGSIKQVLKDYPLVLIFARPQQGGAAYLADVQVAIQDKDEQQVLNVKTDGPYLLVKLPPGTYRVVANAGGSIQSQTVEVQASGTTQKRFDWKQ